jgi:hypothetical protein
VEDDTIGARHPKMLKNGTNEFHPHNELVMSMPFEFIDGSKEKNGQLLPKYGCKSCQHI